VGDKEISFRLPAKEQIFSSLKRLTTTGRHPASYPKDTDKPPPGLKRPDHGAKHLPSFKFNVYGSVHRNNILVQGDSLARGPKLVYLQIFNEFVNQLTNDELTTGFKVCGSVHLQSLKVRLTNRPWLRTLPPPHSYGNQRLQRQFDGLLMMGIVMPGTC